MIKKRRFSKTRFDLAGLTNHIGERKDSEASVMFLPDDHHHRHTGWWELFILHVQIFRYLNMMTRCQGPSTKSPMI